MLLSTVIRKSTVQLPQLLHDLYQRRKDIPGLQELLDPGACGFLHSLI